MSAKTNYGIPDHQGLAMDTATRLLRLGLTTRERPVDVLIHRLERPDGPAWLAAALEGGPLRGLGSPEELLAAGAAGVEQLTAIKERSKSILERAAGADDRLAGLAGYFFSIAAALGHHHTVIGGRRGAERDEVFIDLAACAPGPYRAMFNAAVMAGS